MLDNDKIDVFEVIDVKKTNESRKCNLRISLKTKTNEHYYGI